MTAVLVGCWLNGRSELVYLLLTAVTGLGLVLLPPRCRVPWQPLAAAGALVALGAAALLPVSWAGTVPAWRTHLEQDWGLALPGTISPQPFLTQGALIALAAGIGWFLMLLGRRFAEDSRRAILRAAALGIIVIAAVALAERFGWVVTGWPFDVKSINDLDMGPFGNRNHFSGLCAVGCVLCAGLAQDGFSRRSPLWPVFAAGILVPFSAIAVNTSRGGLALFFIGMMAWLATSSMRRGLFRRVAVMAALSLSAIAGLVLYGGGAGARIAAQELDTPEAALGFRWDIYRETFALILRRFWSGTGLGNFEAVFALEHQLPLQRTQMLHPESDWLWLAYEAGMPALLPLGLGLIWMLRSSGPWRIKRHGSRRRHRDRVLRNTAAIGAALAAVNGLFDVPMHNFALISLALLLGACAVSQRRLKRDAGGVERWVSRLAGLAVLAVAAGYLSGLQGRPVLPGKFHVKTLAAEASAHYREGRLRQAMSRLDEAAALAPLRWDLYYQRALTRLALLEPPEEALADFGRARALKPGNLLLRMAEGKVWLEHQPEFAIVPWRELLTDPQNDYGQMLSLARAHPALRASLRQLASTPALMAAKLFNSNSQEEWQEALDELLAADPNLDLLDEKQRGQILKSWAARGDKARLIERIEANPRWQADAWQLLTEEYASQSEFEKAWRLQRKHAYSTTAVETRTDLPLLRLETDFLYHPGDLKRGIDLYFAQKRQGLTDEALRTLEKLLVLPDAPAWLIQEKAELFAAQKDFRRAYEVMKERLSAK